MRILASDISNRVLEKARKGIYPVARSAEIPKDLLHSFMLRGLAERQSEMKVKVEIQQMVDFRRLNLDQEPELVDGPFDVIFCRNVLIYFDAVSKQTGGHEPYPAPHRRRVVVRWARRESAQRVIPVAKPGADHLLEDWEQERLVSTAPKGIVPRMARGR